MSLRTPFKLERLQTKLHEKAKREPTYRFYALYDKVYREDVLAHAYQLARANRGAPGVDGHTFEKIEEGGLDGWLQTLHKELKEGTYEPSAVRRVMIPKPGGGERPLGIPTIRDRVVQTAVKLILEPIFEADFEDCAYGYRPKRSAEEAVQNVHRGTYQGEHHVVDADLSKFFDTIRHADLLKSLARRISDGKLLRLIKQWLKVPVEERDDKGRRRYSGGKRNTMGTPQGGVISPLLANIYMNRFLRHWNGTNRDERLGRIVNYADDFVILSRSKEQAMRALDETRHLMTSIGLTINDAKTRVCNAREERFTFLGYEIGPRKRPSTGQWYIGAAPSPKAVKRLKERITTMLHRGNPTPWDELRTRLNQVLRGWDCYFRHGSTATHSKLAKYVEVRVRTFLRHRHKVPSRGTRRYGREQCYTELGVYKLGTARSRRTSRISRMPPRKSDPRAGCGKSARPVR